LITNEEKSTSVKGVTARKNIMAIVVETVGLSSSSSSIGIMNGIGLEFSNKEILEKKRMSLRGATLMTTTTLISSRTRKMKKLHNKKKLSSNNEKNILTATNIK